MSDELAAGWYSLNPSARKNERARRSVIERGKVEKEKQGFFKVSDR
jgi:hypothetical protein